VSDTDIEREAVKIDGSLAHSFHSSQFSEIKAVEFLAGVKFVGCTDGSFNDAPGVPEDDSCAGRFAERSVKVRFREVHKVDVCLTDEVCQLTR